MPNPKYVVCLRADVPTMFNDNVRAVCMRCGTTIQHRPHIPQPAHLICLQCLHAIEAAAGRRFDYEVTAQTLDEFARLFHEGKVS